MNIYRICRRDMDPIVLYLLVLVAISLIASTIVTLYKRTGQREPFEDVRPSKPASKVATFTILSTSPKSVEDKEKDKENEKIKDDLTTEINSFILEQMKYMLSVFTYLSPNIDNMVDQSQDIADETCDIVKSIENRYTQRPDEDEDDEETTKKHVNKRKTKAARKTEALQKKYDAQKKQFEVKHKNTPLLECFVDSEDTSEATDVSGANAFHLDTLAPITSFGPSIIPITDLSGNIIEGTSAEDIMKNKHINENKEIMAVESKLLRLISEVNNYVKSYEYIKLIDGLKRIPATAEFSSAFINKNAGRIKHIKTALDIGPRPEKKERRINKKNQPKVPYTNKRYRFPVPYKDSDLNYIQQEHLDMLDNAHELWIQLQMDMGPIFNNAQSSYNKLSTAYAKISNTP